MADGVAVTRPRAATSPLADELRAALDAGTQDAAELARSTRHLRVRVTRLPGRRIEPVGPKLAGPDALLVAEVPDSPLGRSRLDALQLHGVLSMADDPHEDPEVIDREVESLCASILDHYRAHRRAQKENP